MTPRRGNTILFRFSQQLPCLCLRPLKGAMSAQNALQGSETETRELLGGTEEKIISPTRGSLICPPGKSMIFYPSGFPNI